MLFSNVCIAGDDAELSRKLIGYWEEVRVVGCEYHQQRIRINADGTFEINGTIDACNKRTFFVWRGVWKVKNSYLIYKTTYSNSPKDYPNGEIFSDEIKYFNENEWFMIEQSTGNVSHSKRIP
jgi:hypothetical protein